ncbi:hypothetical protein BH20ACT5_BH20ACT5_09150 [soil metagenome]
MSTSLRPRTEPARAALAIAALAVLVAAADTYVVVLALPDIMTGVGIGIDELQRATPIVSVFLLGYVATLPLIGRLADVHGRVPVLVGCLAVFAVGSLLTAAADGLTLLVVGRALQGVGGGGLVPATLALVADLWPPDRRGLPLGVVGAVQEVGSVLGPLYGAVILAIASWRAIFWVNLAVAVVLAGALLLVSRRGRPGAARDLAGLELAGVALVGLGLAVLAPTALTEDLTLGTAFVPLIGAAGWSSPVAVGTLVLGLAFVLRSAFPPAGVRPLVDVRRLPALARQVDLVGAALAALALGGIVLAFAGADPAVQVVADNGRWLLGGAAACGLLFVLYERRVALPLVPAGALADRAAWGALLVNFFVGVALVTALVDIPLFARATRFPDDQLGAALVLVRFLVALPVGALIGGWLCRYAAPRLIAAVGMGLAVVGFTLMTRWDDTSVGSTGATVTLLVCGFGFGLAIAPVNVALLAATRSGVHGIASALSVVTRMVGMLVGVSVLTAVGLRQFYAEQQRIGSPLTLCPDSPADCPAYEVATRAAVLGQLHTIFLGAAVCAAIAGVLALALLRDASRSVSSS